MRRTAGAMIGVLGLACAATPAAGQSEETFMIVRYHEAARAAEMCANVKFTRIEQDKLAALVGYMTQHRVTVGEERMAIRTARTNMEQRIAASGCADPLVADALRFFGTFRDQLR